MLASIWFAIETRLCRITSSVIGSTVRGVWATSCMRALPLFFSAWRHVKRAPGKVNESSAPEEREGFVGSVERPGAAAEKERQERTLAGHLMAGAVKAIECHRAAAPAERPVDPGHLHPCADRQRQGTRGRTGVDIGDELCGLLGSPHRTTPTQKADAPAIIGYE